MSGRFDAVADTAVRLPDGSTRDGPLVDLRDGALTLSRGALDRAVCAGCPTTSGTVAVHSPPPQLVHRRVSPLTPATTVDRRTALAAVAAARGVETPYDDRIGGEADLIDLQAGDRGRTVEVRVLEVDSRTIDGRNGETTILSGVVADESGRLPFTDWAPRPDVEEGASVRLSDVYVREFRGVPQVNLSEFTTLDVLDDPVSVTDSAPRLNVGEAVDAGGMFDVELLGNVLEVRDGSGLIERCPDCSRVVQNGQCRQHGEVDGEDDLRVKAILDDGTGTVTAILDRDLTEEIYGGTMADAMEAAREAMDKEVVADDIADTLVGREYRVRGNLSVDEYGANLEADEFEETDDDPAERAAALLTEVRA